MTGYSEYWMNEWQYYFFKANSLCYRKWYMKFSRHSLISEWRYFFMKILHLLWKILYEIYPQIID